MLGRLILLLLCAFALQAQAVQVTDDRGRVIDLPQPPRRVVSMMPGFTEIVCQLGACVRLVGVDSYSDWPDAVRRLPRLGGLDDANIEQIVALEPDLVIVYASSRAVGRLEAAGIKVLALQPRSLADVRRAWIKLGLALGAQDAPIAWERLEGELDAVARSLPAALRGTTVYFEVNDGPYAASESSFIGELLARLGVANVVPGRLGPFPKLNPEFVVRANPQVIMISERYAQALSRRPGWNKIRAVRDGRVCVFSAQQGDLLVRPGPRMAQAARLMADCLQGRVKGNER
ncbi:MAG TPA: helical backbone metal receptor [Ramlibacter sp.]|nr:helical backbone metal receptor [Ramlibacter sp.]